MWLLLKVVIYLETSGFNYMYLAIELGTDLKEHFLNFYCAKNENSKVHYAVQDDMA